MSRKKSIIVTLLCVVAVVVLGAVLIRQLGRAEEKARRCACMSNVKRIREAIQAYRKDHTGQYPDSLHELCPQYLESLKTLVCPGDVREEATQEDYTSYIYTKPNGEAEPGQIILEEREGNHHNWGKDLAGRMVLRADGKVEWVPDTGQTCLGTCSLRRIHAHHP